MSRFYDFNFADDDPGPDTDPTVDFPEDAENGDNIPNDATNYDEPGSGDTFSGRDPSVWDGSGNPEEPEAQDDQAAAPIETEAQSATVPPPAQYGQRDNPEATPQQGDDQSGDDEDDDSNVEDHFPKLEPAFYPEDLLDELSVQIDISDDELQELLDELLEEVDDVYQEYIEDNDAFFEDEEEALDLDILDAPIPDLGEFVGTLDISDYIGDLANDSNLIEFQDLWAEMDDNDGLL